MLDDFNMSLGSGLAKLAGRVFRIGHLGECNELTLMGTLAGIEMELGRANIPYRASGMTPAMAQLLAQKPASQAGSHLSAAAE